MMKKRAFAMVSLGGLFCFMKIVAAKRTEPSGIDDDNPYLHPEKADVLPEEVRSFALRLPVRPARKKGLYERFGKVLLDNLLSFCGLLVLSPVFLLLTALIKIDDPGPVFFTQKRIGKDKRYFALHKFRSITASTAAFIIGLNLPPKHNMVVNRIAGTTFGIYISHANIYFINLIYHRIMHTKLYIESPYMPVHFIVCIVAQFAICSVLEMLRQLAWKPTVEKCLCNSKWLKKENEWEQRIFVSYTG